METVNPNNPHTVAYARRIAELEETIRVQGERLKLLEFANSHAVAKWVPHLHHLVFVVGPCGQHWEPSLVKAIQKVMGLCVDEGCENQPAPHTHPGLPPWKIVLD
jgi:tryptophan synthase beta subunit